MLWLSEVLIENYGLQSFAALVDLIGERGAAGEMFFRMDVKPPFQDTPPDWEDRLEAAFHAAKKS